MVIGCCFFIRNLSSNCLEPVATPKLRNKAPAQLEVLLGKESQNIGTWSVGTCLFNQAMVVLYACFFFVLLGIIYFVYFCFVLLFYISIFIYYDLWLPITFSHITRDITNLTILNIYSHFQPIHESPAAFTGLSCFGNSAMDTLGGSGSGGGGGPKNPWRMVRATSAERVWF